MNVYVLVVTPLVVVYDWSTGVPPRNQVTDGDGSPPVDEHVKVILLPSTINVGPVITGGPGAAIKERELMF